MAVQRKIFSIEKHARPKPGATPPADMAETPERHQFMAELKALRALAEPRPPVPREQMERARAQIAEAQAYKHELDLIYAAVHRSRADGANGEIGAGGPVAIQRVGRELDAIVTGAEQTARTILQTAEEIGDLTGAFAESASGAAAQELAREIQDRVALLFVACNVHDITGQRVAKVQEALAFIDAHVARLMEIWHGIEQFKPVVLDGDGDGDGGGRLLNGPRLAGDNGHSTQDEIDDLFRSA